MGDKVSGNTRYFDINKPVESDLPGIATVSSEYRVAIRLSNQRQGMFQTVDYSVIIFAETKDVFQWDLERKGSFKRW